MNDKVREALKKLVIAVGGDGPGSEPNVYADYDKLSSLMIECKKALASSPWQPIETAPKDGTDILVFHKVHGPMAARFCPGEWHEHHEYGPQYDGPVWCFGDDAFQEEVEEYGDTMHHGQVTHWMPLPTLPKGDSNYLGVKLNPIVNNLEKK